MNLLITMDEVFHDIVDCDDCLICLEEPWQSYYTAMRNSFNKTMLLSYRKENRIVLYTLRESLRMLRKG